MTEQVSGDSITIWYLVYIWAIIKNQSVWVLGNNQQVAQGQYVVSDTRCPALSDCELE